MNITTLPLADLWQLHEVPVEFSNSYSEEDFDAEWQELRDALRRVLEKKWTESCFGDGDFAIADDRSKSWCQSGGIQNIRMISSETISVLAEQLARSRHPSLWGLLISVECRGSNAGDQLLGEFLLKNGALYVGQYKKYDDKRLVQLLKR